MTRLRVVLGCLLVLVPLVGAASPAAAVDQDVATCLVSGQLATSSLQPLPAPITFSGYLILDCVTVGTGDDGGQWFLPFDGAGQDSCAAGTGGGNIRPGATSAFDGDVWAGGFNYVHTGLNVTVEGTLYTDNDGWRGHFFTAELAVVPSSLSCPTFGGPSSLNGVANITDGVQGPNINAGAGACTADGLESYPAWPLDPAPAFRPAQIDLRLNCTGIGPASGFWGMLFDGSGLSSCAAEQGSASVVSSFTPIGPVSGSVSWVRVGVYMKIDGVVSDGSSTAAFTGVVGWTGLPGCLSPTPYAPFAGVVAMAVA